MSSIAAESHLHRAFHFYHESLGKKVVMAVTGVVLFGYLVGHLLGNLQVYLGAEKMDGYAAFLHSMPALLWGVRVLLVVSVVAHIVASIQLARVKQTARPVSYAKKENIASSYASRTMMWSGPIIALFVIFHILDLHHGHGGGGAISGSARLRESGLQFPPRSGGGILYHRYAAALHASLPRAVEHVPKHGPEPSAIHTHHQARGGVGGHSHGGGIYFDSRLSAHWPGWRESLIHATRL